MKTLILETNRRCLLVEKNEDDTLNIKPDDKSPNIPSIAAFISSIGGVNMVLSRCVEYNGNFDDYVKERNVRLAEISERIKLEREDRKKRNEELKAKFEAENQKAWEELSTLDVIPATTDNVRVVLRHLNSQNWGSWSLPKLSIGYSAHQYDCDGKQATTITLDKPISDDTYGISSERKFKVGGSKGHLIQYQTL